MRGGGRQGGRLCIVLESNLRLTHPLPFGEERETRFRLLWIYSVVKIFYSLPSLRGDVYFAEDLVFYGPLFTIR